MAKLLLKILATILLTSALCFAQEPDPSETEEASGGEVNVTVSSIAVESTAVEVSPSVMPSPSAIPIEPATGARIAPVLRNSNGGVCISVNATITFRVSYVNKESDNDTLVFAPEDYSIDSDSSFCNRTIGDKREAKIVLTWAPTEGTDNYTMFFLFESGKENWELASINLTVPGAQFKDPKNPIDKLEAGTDNLMAMQAFNLSYLCDTTRNLTMNINETAAINYTAVIEVANLQVQAFSFANSTSGMFDDYSRCAEDIKGSKIVPIAVGAALAGLVIIVLIAYIIGRLRSRKQSSYEALS